MSIERRPFGTTLAGQAASLFVLPGAGGARLTLSDFGARVVGITVPDARGVLADVALGYDSPEAYTAQGRYFGATCGRYANRLADARFTLNGQSHALFANDGTNSLHGGQNAYDVRVWDATVHEDKNAVSFRLLSPDGDEGYPGNLMMSVTYTFAPKNTLRIEYKAVADADTVVNLTNHAYFNLAGHAGGPIAGHVLQMEADFITPVDEKLLPDGEIRPVTGTPFDFTAPHPLGERADADDVQLKRAGGYDHNFVLRKAAPAALQRAATVTEPNSGRVMEVYTDQPGIQLYCGNFMAGLAGKEGAVYGHREGFCLETQRFPNSVDVTHFPSPILRAGQLYTHHTEYQFTTTG